MWNLFQLQRLPQYSNSGQEASHKTDAIEELKNAFEVADRSCPFTSVFIVSDMIRKLLPSMPENRLHAVVDRLTR